MLAPTGVALTFGFQINKNGEGVVGLSPPVNVTRRDGTVVATSGTATEFSATRHPGLYLYTVVSGSNTVETELFASVIVGSGVADQRHTPALWVVRDWVGYVASAGATLSTLSSATIDARLVAYDAPTKAELDSAQASIEGAVGTRLADADYVAPDNSSVASILAIAEKLDDLLELDGAIHRLTANALEQAPTGGGATLEEIAARIISDHGTGSYVGGGGTTTHILAPQRNAVLSALETVVEGATWKPLEFVWPEDLTGVSAITGRLYHIDNATRRDAEGSFTITDIDTDADETTIQWQLAAEDADTPGEYEVQFTATFAGGVLSRTYRATWEVEPAI